MSRLDWKRSRPAELIPGTVSCISVRMDYWPEDSADAAATLEDGNLAYLSRYALGRDYHRVLRSRLQKLCDLIHDAVGPFGHRVFTDSAPVLEKALARNAGLGWIGKHTNLIDRNAGSYFFLGEIYVDLELPPDDPAPPTAAPAAPACPPAPPCHRRPLHAGCPALHFLPHHRVGGQHPGGISRTHRQSHLRPADDCQLACPWNKFAKPTAERDFAVRHGLDHSQLAELFAWSEGGIPEKDARKRHPAHRL